MADFDLFAAVWDVLSRQGKCDTIGGAEYRRVRAEWLRAGKPPAFAFIMRQANQLPESTADGIDLSEIGREIGELDKDCL